MGGGAKSILGPETIVEKIVGQKKKFDLKKKIYKILGLKSNFRFEKILGPKKFDLKHFFGSKGFSGLKTVGSNKILGLEIKSG